MWNKVNLRRCEETLVNEPTSTMTLSLRLPDSRREDYSNPWGPVVSGSLMGLARKFNGLICVGDIVSRYCLELEDKVGSLILVYDMRTRRIEALHGLLRPGFKVLRVINERGTVSLEAYRTLCSLVSLNNVKVVIEVLGEEDMLALPAIACLRAGWAVVYGIPGMGACVVGYSTLGTRIAQTRVLQLKPFSSPNTLS